MPILYDIRTKYIRTLFSRSKISRIYYIIFAPNLVPCCSKCNTNKGDIVTINGERQFLHFYFDEIPTEQYLYADIDMQDGIPVITFTIRLDESKMINRIIKNHYHRLKLIERYMVHCNSLISTLRALKIEKHLNRLYTVQYKN